MALFILKWAVGMIVLAVGVLFGLSIALNAKATDVYMMSGATMIAISFIIAGANIFFMGTTERKKMKEIKMNKKLLLKAEDLSSKKIIDIIQNSSDDFNSINLFYKIPVYIINIFFC